MGLLRMLLDNPAFFFRFSLFRIPTLLIALCLHEWAHAFVANRCGDPTARMLGRLTLNPLKHLDPVGTFLMFTMGFGWAKPVPVNPNHYRNRLWDDVKVSLAGVTVNFLLFLLFTAMDVAVNRFVWRPEVLQAMDTRELLAFDGGAYMIYMYPGQYDLPLRMRSVPLGGVLCFLQFAAQVNLMLAIFNLFPIPPLDGYHVFNDILFKGRLNLSPNLFRFGMLFVLLLSFSTDVLSNIMSFLSTHIQGGALAVFALLAGR
ncbi:MAG: site-2 protease family protein [Oscillospiraceae bacterium]|jgi:Zn-dependent protease|nr:site-2 protease family protein [Oscillospiraceae bacterium]